MLEPISPRAAEKVQVKKIISRVFTQKEKEARAAAKAAALTDLPNELEILINDLTGSTNSRGICKKFSNLVSSISIMAYVIEENEKHYVSNKNIMDLIEKNQEHLKILDLSGIDEALKKIRLLKLFIILMLIIIF
tara:strand:- start:410 stop:814 length:405 start_codon:yes stop_codon:yes gene_type:complete